MKLAIAAALAAALLLGAVALGRLGGEPGPARVDRIELSSQNRGSPAPVATGGPEHVKREVSEHLLDDHGGRRPDDGGREDNSGKGSENSGSGSENSGSGSENSGRDDGKA